MKNQLRSLMACVLIAFSHQLFAQGTGIFEGQSDIGRVKHKGGATYNSILQQYDIKGSGTNIWFNHDEFHFVWKRMKGDFLLRTNGAFVGKGIEQHRKWGWMVRTSLDTASAHINAVVHGDGLTSLQYRRTTGATTEEIKSKLTHADVIQLERKGNTYIMSVARKGETFVTEELKDLNLGDDVYVGLFVCSHNPDVTEEAVFNNVRIVEPAPAGYNGYQKHIGSALEILDVNAQNSRIIYQTPASIQAPNWTPDNKYLIYNEEGLLYKYDLKTNTPAILNTGNVKQNNNDHVLSFNGKMLAISSSTEGSNGSIGWVVPVTGGEPRRMNKIGPSYMHGWSPDGKYLVFTGQRNNEFDIYRMPAAGGEEERFTTAPGLDDGPEYTPDGKYIYFNSVRTGLMQIWRMKADGTEQTQITNDEFNNWFPHISPDGKWIVFISFLKNEVDPGDHPFYRHVYLKMIPIQGGQPKVIAYLYGGQGTINTPSWAPDSKHLAFISNSQLLYPIFPIEK